MNENEALPEPIREEEKIWRKRVLLVENRQQTHAINIISIGISGYGCIVKSAIIYGWNGGNRFFCPIGDR